MKEAPTGHDAVDAAEEIANFERITRVIKQSPGAIPKLAGVDVAGASIPKIGAVGGDHLIYIDFNERYDLGQRIAHARAHGRDEVALELERAKDRAGILIADVSGHRVTDAVVTAMLHQAFLLGVSYELEAHGRITTALFEHLNQRFYRTTNIQKYITMIYGEISTQGRFRFISAGHPRPLVFSREFERFVPIGEDRLVLFPPLGMFPSDGLFSEGTAASPLGVKRHYAVNTIDLLSGGDILLLHTDGLSDHADGRYFAGLEAVIREVSSSSAEEIAGRIERDLLALRPLSDDTSFVVVKRSSR